MSKLYTIIVKNEKTGKEVTKTVTIMADFIHYGDGSYKDVALQITRDALDEVNE